MRALSLHGFRALGGCPLVESKLSYKRAVFTFKVRVDSCLVAVFFLEIHLWPFNRIKCFKGTTKDFEYFRFCMKQLVRLRLLCCEGLDFSC